MEHITQCPICGHEKFELKFYCQDTLLSHEQFAIYSCTNCRFLFTQDIPSLDTIDKYYEATDYVSHSDTQSGLMNLIYHRVRKQMIRRKTKLVETYTPTGNLLDIGCGTGYFAGAMKSRGWNVVALEPAEVAATIARQKFALDVRPPQALFDLSAQQFDVITLWHVLEHLVDLNEQMVQFRRLMNDNATLVIAVPNVCSYDAEKYKQNWAAYDVPRHVWHFSPTTFASLAQKHGFEIKAIKPMPFDAFYISMLSEKSKGRKMAFIKGTFAGAVAYVASLFNKTKSSSLIYILKKK